MWSGVVSVRWGGGGVESDEVVQEPFWIAWAVLGARRRITSG